MHGSGMQLERSQRPQIVALRIFFFFLNLPQYNTKEKFLFFLSIEKSILCTFL